MREIIASIDIGSSKVKMVVSEIVNEKLNVLCAIDEVSKGVKKGSICEPDETTYVLKKLLKKSEERLGFKIKSAVVSVAEDATEFKIGEASITITSEDKEITSQDVIRVMQASVKGNIPREMELITVMPIMFKVDDQKTRMPKGMKGESLTVRSVVVSTMKKDIYLAAKCLEKCGVEVIDIMLPSIGSYFAHNNETTDADTGVVVDVGHDTIKLAVFNKGIIINNLVMNIGGKNVIDDISFVYKLNEKDSDNLSHSLALANKKNAKESEREVIVNNLGEKIVVNQYELTEVVMSRLHEMLNMAKNQINYLTKKEISYIIITGGLSELKDFQLEVESVFGKNAYVGKMPIVGCRDNSFASCIGMIKYFDNKLKLREREYSSISSDDEDTLNGLSNKKIIPSDSLLGKVFGIFFDS